MNLPHSLVFLETDVSENYFPHWCFITEDSEITSLLEISETGADELASLFGVSETEDSEITSLVEASETGVLELASLFGASETEVSEITSLFDTSLDY